MKIYLAAFVDTRFENNFLIHTVAARYPEHTFYLLVREGSEKACQQLQEQEENIRLVNKGEEKTFLQQMDAMVAVGADLFSRGEGYNALMEQANVLKKQGGRIIFLGIGLYGWYPLAVKIRMSMLFSKADVIVVTDEKSRKRMKQIAPWVRVTLSADMAFTMDLSEVKKEPTAPEVLGIALRKDISGTANDSYQQYCKVMAETVTRYLNMAGEKQVTFLVFSRWNSDDVKVVQDIWNLCPLSCRHKLSCTDYEGDRRAFLSEVQKCGKIMTTEFTTLVLALMLGKPVVPLVYENRMNRLLDEIGYQGMRSGYERDLNWAELLRAFQDNHYSEEALEQYMRRADGFFEETDACLKGK